MAQGELYVCPYGVAAYGDKCLFVHCHGWGDGEGRGGEAAGSGVGVGCGGDFRDGVCAADGWPFGGGVRYAGGGFREGARCADVSGDGWRCTVECGCLFLGALECAAAWSFVFVFVYSDIGL